MSEIIKNYENKKSTLSLTEKVEMVKELAKIESELTGLSETQKFGEEIIAEFKKISDKSYAMNKEVVNEIRIQKLSQHT